MTTADTNALAYALLQAPLTAVPLDELEQRTGIDIDTFRAAGAQTYRGWNEKHNSEACEYVLVSAALLTDLTR